MVSLAMSQTTSIFSACAVVTPDMLNPEDAKKIEVPLVLLASSDESVAKVKEFMENLRVAKHDERFSNQRHGWMAARANLESTKVKEDYERGYKTVLDFWAKHWKAS